jgi:hypothetical protein
MTLTANKEQDTVVLQITPNVGVEWMDQTTSTWYPVNNDTWTMPL